MTGEQARTAARIDAAMQPLLREGANEIAILTSMGDHMADFKTLIDTAKPGVMDQLCQRYPGFYQHAKVFEHIAGAIQSEGIASSVMRTTRWVNEPGTSASPEPGGRL